MRHQFDVLFARASCLVRRKLQNKQFGSCSCNCGYIKDHFIIRNSWGFEYGENGYAYASNEYIKAGMCKAYGIIL